MEDNNNTITSLHQLLNYDARKFLVSEVQLQNILPKWMNTAGSIKLKTVLQRYLDYVQQHVQKMEEFFAQENNNSPGFSNRVMQIFIEEAEEKLANCKDAALKDACLLASVQQINHFKISMYGTAAAFANALGMEKSAEIFHEAEVNEKQVDDRLSQLAEHEINNEARTTIVLNR